MYKSFFENIMLMNGYDIKSFYKKLLAIKTMSPEKFDNWKEEKRWNIVEHHFLNNEFYKDRLGNRMPNNWNELPILNKSDLQISIENILSNGYNKKNVYIANTSGSSGHPFYFAKDKDCHAFTWAFIKWRYNDLGISLDDLEARFYGIPLDFFSKIREKIKDKLLSRIRFAIFDFSDSAMDRFVKKFKNNKIQYIYGYTNSIVLFSRYLIKNKINLIDLCPSIRLVIVTSEVCTSEDRRIINKAISVPLYNEYGASEFAYIGYDNNGNDWKIAEEMIYIEKNSSDGSLLITDLHNKAFPFIRYNIGDLGELYTDSNNYTYLKCLEGRQNDTIVLPSGKKSAGLTFYYISRSILEKSGSLKEFIIRQVSIDKFIFDIVSDHDLSSEEIDTIQSNLDKYLEEGLKLEINRVKEIKRPDSGKIKHFYSEIDKNND